MLKITFAFILQIFNFLFQVVKSRGDDLDSGMSPDRESPPREDSKPPYSYAQLIIQVSLKVNVL